MSFDDQLAKQERILNYIKENITSMNNDQIRDYSQEFFRCEKIMKHQLRGLSNPAGRYLGSVAFGIAGTCLVLTRKPVLKSLIFTLKPQDYAFIGFSFILGYYYAATFHGNRDEHNRLYDKFLKTSIPLKKDFDETMNRKLN
jgi:hypothetical protein